MSTVLKYAGFFVLVLFALVLTAVCGELACESLVHACCGRVDRAERFQRRIVTALARASKPPSQGPIITDIARVCGVPVPSPLLSTSLASVSLRV